MIYKKKAAAAATAILLFSATLTAGAIAPYRSSFAFKDKEIETHITGFIPFVDWVASSVISDNSTTTTNTNDDSDAVPPYPGDGNNREMRNASELN